MEEIDLKSDYIRLLWEVLDGDNSTYLERRRAKKVLKRLLNGGPANSKPVIRTTTQLVRRVERAQKFRQLRNAIDLRLSTSKAIDTLFGVSNARARKSIPLPPGTHLNRFASFFYSKKNYERVFQPTLADMQQEYFEALSQKDMRRAQWIAVRGRLSFIAAMLAQMPMSATQLVKKLWTAAS